MTEKAMPLFFLILSKILEKQWPTVSSVRGFQPSPPRLHIGAMLFCLYCGLDAIPEQTWFDKGAVCCHLSFRNNSMATGTIYSVTEPLVYLVFGLIKKPKHIFNIFYRT